MFLYTAYYMETTILCIQFRKSGRASDLEQKSIRRGIDAHISLVFVSALDKTVLWNNPEVLLSLYNGAILGGSGDFDFDGNREQNDPAREMSYQLLEQLRPTFEYIFEHDIPTLGICFGHQMLGAFAGVTIASDTKQKKIKSHTVALCESAKTLPIFKDVPLTFKAQYIHTDVLSAVPQGATLLGEGGESCCVSVLRYKNNIYSTQFHPELNVSDMALRVSSFPGYLPEGVTVEEIFEEGEDANKILRNFGRLVDKLPCI